MSVRSLAARVARVHVRDALIGVVVGAMFGVGGFAATTIALRSFDSNTVGVLRVQAVTPPADVNCGSLRYVQVTGAFGGVQHITGACINPDVATDARTDDVANALADEN